MTSQSNLDIKGNLREHPLPELLLEISQTNLSGSIRLSSGDLKAVVYLSDGSVVFAVSNQRQHRLFEILVREKRFSVQQIVDIPNFTSDFELGRVLVRNKLLAKSELDDFFVYQIKEILRSIFQWPQGEWVFSSLARVKEGIYFYLNLQQILVDYARGLSSANVSNRFMSLQESFQMKSGAEQSAVSFLPREAFVLSRFENAAMKIEDVKSLSGLSAPETFHVLYVLWLGGFLVRQNWNTAFSERRIADILSTRLTLKRGGEESPKSDFAQVSIEATPAVVRENVEPAATAAPEKPAEAKLTLDEYLTRTEAASNHYDTLGIEPKSESSAVKKAYFAFARQFHPDLYHRQAEAATHTRIQNAFTKIAHAYETLKDEKSREVYDFKLRKELAEKSRQAESGTESVDLQGQAHLAEENFKSGFTLLMNENYSDALPFLGRAAHLAPGMARYHAFYGKALSFDETQRHKAEAEMQKAVKIEPDNVTFRIILAEFFIEYKLLKRAEGELRRLLAIAPDSVEAKTLLDSLSNK